MPLHHTVTPGSRVNLREIDPRSVNGYKTREAAAADFAAGITRLCDLQERLLAESKQSLLVVLQAMDAGGKDGAIRKVIGPLDSRGVHVWSFKSPSEDERAHDYLWRCHARTPRKGEIAVFNRSYYEDVLVVRVMKLAEKSVWSRRFDHIQAFEQLLQDEGTRVLKIFLHISKEEQAERLQERVDDPTKRWKFDPRDLDMRAKWDDFQEAFEDAMSRTSTKEAPWHIVPADRKWARDLALLQLLIGALEEMDPQWPKPTWDPGTVKIT